MEPKLQWLLLVVSNAPIQSVDEAEYKAAVLKELCEQIRQEVTN